MVGTITQVNFIFKDALDVAISKKKMSSTGAEYRMNHGWSDKTEEMTMPILKNFLANALSDFSISVISSIQENKVRKYIGFEVVCGVKVWWFIVSFA